MIILTISSFNFKKLFMKKITLWLFLIIGFISFSQNNISQDFPTTTTPAGWNLGGGSLTTTQACATASWRFNVYSGSSATTNFLSSETFVSTGEPLNVSFDYKVVDWSAATVATTPYNGTIVVETSSDNGTTYGNAVVAVNNANHVVANTCATKSVVIPGSSAPGGSNTKIRIKCSFGTSGDYYVYLDNVVITQAGAPPCIGTPAPGNTLAPASICFGSSAVLSLQNYTPGSGVTYQWYLNAVAIGGANSSSYTIPSVTSNGTYYCDVTCASSTTASGSLVVGPTILSSPLLEPFATFLPSCWTNMFGGDITTGPTASTGSGWVADGFANAGTTGAIKNEIWTTGANDWIISPVINIPATGYELKFDAAAPQWNATTVPTTAWEADDYVEVLVAVGGSTTNWTVLHTYNDSNQPSNAGTPNILDLDAYASQNIRIAFRAVEGTANGAADIDFSIDNFQIRLTPACSEPTGIVTASISDTSFDMSWTEPASVPSVGYEYIVSTSNAVPVVNGTPVTNSYASPSGLLPNTVYYIFVRSDCGASGYSAWTGPVSITTACAAYSVPLLENFATFLPSVCWFNRFGGDLTNGPNALTGSGWVADGFANVGTTGAIRNEIFTTGANDWIISPRIAIPTTGYELKFDAAATQFGSVNAPTSAWESDDYVEVLVSTTGMTNWTVIHTYNDTNQPLNGGSPNILDLDAYSGQNIRIAFRAVEGATNGAADIDFSIDNFQIRLTPTCIEPLNLVFSSVTSTTANISWDDTTPSPGVGFEYFVSTSSTVPVTAGTATTSTFAPLSGLLPQTTYYIFVRSNCGSGDFSYWTGPISFTTACAPSVTLPWTENFDALATGTNIFPSCWGYTNAAGSWTISTAPTAYSGANSLRRTWSTDGWAFTPMFTLAAGTSYTFSYYVRTNDAIVGYDITVGAGTSQTSAAMTSTLSTVVGYQGPAWTFVTLEFTPPVSGDYSFGVKVVAPVAPNGINFDNFELKLTPACPTPVASVGGITHNAANLSWPAVASASSGYEYVLDNVAGNPAGSGTATSALTYPASGLTPLTTYYFHIRSMCSAGTYSTWTTISFTTLATPPANDNCVDAIALTPGAVFATNPLVATNVGATGSTETAPGCASYSGGDVWYSVVVPASGSITLETNTNAGTTITDTGLAVYSGACGALVLVECDDDDSTSGNFSLIALTGRTPGEVLKVRAWEYSNDAFSTFQVSAYDASLSSSSFDKSTFVAYPNPVKDVLNLSYKTVISNVRVINLLGQEVLNTKTNSNDVLVNMSALNAGAYIVNITVEDMIHTIKVIKE